MEVVIEVAQLDDLSVIVKLLGNLYSELGEEKESLEFLNVDLISSMSANNKTTVLKVRAGARIVGMASMTETQAIYAGGYYGVIDEMYVEPGFRNNQIGSKIIEKVRAIAVEKKWKRVDVTAPTEGGDASRRFYERNGFVFTGPKMKLKVIV